MARKFISFLGTGNYQECRYRLNDKKISEPVIFIQEALVHFLCGGYGENDSVCIFVTEEARQKHWDALKARLDRPGLRCPVKMVAIKDSKTEADVWSLFQTLYDTIDEGDAITFDLTHSFRYLPLLFFSILNYAQYLKHIRVTGLYYGAWEARDSDGNIAPVFNLRDAYRLLQWASAADSFINYGAAAKLIQVTQGVDMEQPAELARNINSISEIFNCTRGYEITDGTVFSDTIAQVKALENSGALPPAFTPILETLVGHLSKFKQGSSLNFIPAVQWYLDHDMFAQGYTMLREGIVSFLMDAAGFAVTDRHIRDTVSSGLGYHSNDFKNNPRIDEADIPTLEKIMERPLAARLKPIYIKICKSRNDIDHAGMQADSKTTDELRNELTQYFFQVKAILENEGTAEAVRRPHPQELCRFVGTKVGPKQNLKGTLNDGRSGTIARKYFEAYSRQAADYIGKELEVRVTGENPQKTGFLLELVTRLE